MGTKDKIISTFHTIEGKQENISMIVDTIEQFFDNLQVDVEDWKISTEESHEGTRLFVRLQVLVKKKEAAHDH
jgi:hypothetical protein